MSRMVHDSGILAVTAVAPALWATSFVVTTELLPEGRPVFSAAARVLPAAVVLSLLVRRLPHGRWWWRSAVLAALNVVAFYPMQFLAAYRLPGGTASSIGAAAPLLTMLVAWPLLAERLNTMRLLAGASGLGGVCLVVLDSAGTLDWLGLAAAFGATSATVLGSVLVKRWRDEESIATVMTWQFVAGSLILLPAALLVEGSPPALDANALVGYAWLALASTVAAQACWLFGMTRLSAGSASLIGLLYPVVATALGAVVVGESISVTQASGIGIVALSVIAGQPSTPRLRRRLPSAPRRRHAANSVGRVAMRSPNMDCCGELCGSNSGSAA